MVIMDGHPTNLDASYVATRKHPLLLLVARAGMGLSLVASALGGAVVATQLRPVTHVAAALQRPAPVHHVHVAVARIVPTPAAPERAMLATDTERATPNGAWIQSRTVTLRITLAGTHAGTALRAEAEIAPADVPFTGTPIAFSALQHSRPGVALQVPIVVNNLVDGQRYHWQVRAWAVGGKVSRWSGGSLFGVSVSQPLPPQLATTNVRIGAWSTLSRLFFRWTDAGSRAPISFYEYTLLPAARSAQTARTLWHRAHGATLSLDSVADGSWQLLVRAVDLAGNRSSPAIWPFGLARHAPPAPQIVSATPAQNGLSNTTTPVLHWRSTPAIAPIRTYQYGVLADLYPTAVPSRWVSVSGQTLSLPELGDAGWQVLVRSVDAAGNVSQSLRWTFHLDRQHPLLTPPTLATQSFTPPVERLRVRFGLGKQATVAYSVYAAGNATPVFTGSLGMRDTGQISALTWDGRVGPKHKLAPAGNYTIVIEAVDAAGNRTEVRTAPVTLLSKRIVISISKEALWAYEGNKLVFYTLVTNGGADTPTLPGIFHVEGKYTGFVFHSPWPKGSPLWYPDSPTSFALLYNANGGYFLHDAPWRYNFGPGSNSVAGTPGGSYTGTHGCTNVPYTVMGQIFNWADVGTAIKIVP